MTTEEEIIDPLEEIRAEVGRLVTNQTKRLSRHDTAISNIIDCIGDLTNMMKDL